MRPGTRRVVIRFAQVVCPPEAAMPGRLDATLREFDLMLAALGAAARRLVPLLFLVLDQGARLYPRCHGRLLHGAAGEAAGQYVERLLGRRNVVGELTGRLKSLVVMCYYEQPEVKREIGYLPEPYIAAVTRRRLERYGADIRAAQARAGEP